MAQRVGGLGPGVVRELLAELGGRVGVENGGESPPIVTVADRDRIHFPVGVAVAGLRAPGRVAGCRAVQRRQAVEVRPLVADDDLVVGSHERRIKVRLRVIEASVE